MSTLGRNALVRLLGVVALSWSTHAADNAPLFINLTTDDAHRARMALEFGKNQWARGHPLTIFLNDKGVLLAAKERAETFAEHRKTLSALLADGAVVLVCPMCMRHYGVQEADLPEGLTVGNPERTGNALFKANTQTLTW
jgi:sulfur relay (sulfurtransferase) complex TusBCD TusD component (DsrE family)